MCVSSARRTIDGGHAITADPAQSFEVGAILSLTCNTSSNTTQWTASDCMGNCFLDYTTGGLTISTSGRDAAPFLTPADNGRYKCTGDTEDFILTAKGICL